MNINELYKDIQYRAYNGYKVYNNNIKTFCPEKWYNSDFQFKIIDNSEINGKSWCEQTTDFVEINSGVIEIYYKYFCNVTEKWKNSFLREIMPDKSEEEINKMSVESIVFRNGKVELTDSKVFNDDIAVILEIFVSRFILFHELGHIFNGHCKYLAKCNKNEFNYMPMYFGENYMLNNKISALDIRTMEMDADAFATTQGLVHIVYLYNNFSTQVGIKSIQPIKIFFLWTFAIRSHFLLCEDHFADNNYFPEMKHLPSIARWNLVWGSIDSILKSDSSFNNLNKEIILNELINGAIYAEKTFNELKCSLYRWEDEIDGNDMYYKYIREINDNWAKLRKSLENYSRLYLYEE